MIIMKKYLAVAMLLFCVACDDPKNASDIAFENLLDKEDQNSKSGNFLAGIYANKRYRMDDAANFYAKILEDGEENENILKSTYSLFAAAGDFEKASKYAAEYLKDNPDSSTPNIIMAIAEVLKNDFTSAKKHVDAIPYKNFDRFLKPGLQSWVEAALGNEKEAFAKNKEIENIFPDFYIYNRALLNEYFNHPEQAEKLYATFIKKPAVSSRIAQVSANFYARRGEYQKGLDIFSNLKTGKNSIIVRYNMDRLGEDILREAGGEKVTTKYEQLVKTPTQGMGEVFLSMVDFSAGLGSFDAATLFSRLAFTLNDDLDIAKTVHAEILELRRSYVEANKIYASFDVASPFYYYVNLRLANNLLRKNNIKDAQDVYKRIIKAYPNKVEAYIDLANSYKIEKKYQRALNNYNKAISLINEPSGSDWIVFYNRGIMYEELKEYQKSEDDFLKALEISPQNPILLNHIGYTWIERGKNVTQGINMVKLAVEKMPNDANIIDSLGWAYYIQGQYEQAVETIERALTKDNSNSVINEHLGDAYWQTGRYLEAKYQWNKALYYHKKDGYLKDPQEVRRKIKKGMKQEIKE